MHSLSLGYENLVVWKKEMNHDRLHERENVDEAIFGINPALSSGFLCDADINEKWERDERRIGRPILVVL